MLLVRTKMFVELTKRKIFGIFCRKPPPRFKYCWIRVRVRVRIHIGTNPDPPVVGVFFFGGGFLQKIHFCYVFMLL